MREFTGKVCWLTRCRMLRTKDDMRKTNASLRVQRRVFLSALGMGLGVAAASRLSNVALAQATPASKRFMLFYMPHGVPPEHFQPVGMANDPTSFALDKSGVSILGPLQEQLRSYTTIVQGLMYPKGAMTHEALAVALSGVGAGDKLPEESVSRVSLEHQIANALGVKPLVLGAIPHRPFGLDKDGKLMWDGTPVVPEKNPIAAYDAVFSGLTSTPAPAGETDPNVALTEALRGLTEAELESMQQELSALTAEQTKLKTHLDAIAARAERFTGADLEDVVRRAGLAALRRGTDTQTVTMADFEDALADSRASVTPEVEREYEAMATQLKQQASAPQTIGFAFPARQEE